MTEKTERPSAPEFDVAAYWRRRYARGGTSGAGSYGVLANYKIAFLNRFLRGRGIRSVIDLGCGDGAQIEGLACPDYFGVDLSEEALARCRALHGGRPEWSFALARADGDYGPPRDLALSLDVVYHLVEDAVFDAYMRALFANAGRFVVIYGSDWDAPAEAAHMRHRWHSGWAARHAPGWRVVRRAPNPYPFDPENNRNTTHASFTVYAAAREE